MGKLPTCYGFVADLLVTRPTSLQQVVVMEFGKRHDTTDTTDFCPCQLVTDLLRTCRLCCGLATGKSPTCNRETDVMDFGLYTTTLQNFSANVLIPQHAVKCTQNEDDDDENDL